MKKKIIISESYQLFQLPGRNAFRHLLSRKLKELGNVKIYLNDEMQILKNVDLSIFKIIDIAKRS